MKPTSRLKEIEQAVKQKLQGTTSPTKAEQPQTERTKPSRTKNVQKEMPQSARNNQKSPDLFN